MTTDNEHTIYTDGHGIRITDRNFYTTDKTYLIEGITDVRLVKKSAGKWPGILLFVLGLAGLVIGSFEYLADWELTFGNATYIVDSNTVLLISGVALILMGITLMIARKDHYAVAIRTAEGLRQPVDSKSREYVAHLVHLLRSTYHDHFVPKQKRVSPVVH